MVEKSETNMITVKQFNTYLIAIIIAMVSYLGAGIVVYVKTSNAITALQKDITAQKEAAHREERMYKYNKESTDKKLDNILITVTQSREDLAVLKTELYQVQKDVSEIKQNNK